MPLHPALRDIYFDQVVNRDSPHYNTGGYIKLKGSLNKGILKKVARSVPKFFDAFKFRFDLSSNDQGFYVDKNFLEFDIAEIDFSEHLKPQEEAERWVQNRFNTP